MAISKQKRVSGEAGILRVILVSASIFLAHVWLAPGAVIAESDSDEEASEPELVTGEEMAHWSGLPVWGRKEAYEYGFELPLPLGVSGCFYAEKQNFDMLQLNVGKGDALLNIGNLVEVTDIKTEQTAWNVHLDSWILPFLNMYAIAGYLDGQAELELRPATLPFLRPLFPKYDMKLEYEGPLLGLGGTLAAGFKPVKNRPTIVFGQADLSFTKALLDFRQVVSSLDTVDVAVLNMRLGVRERIETPRGDVHVTMWGGATCQDVQQVMTGSLGILDLDFRAKVGAVNPWNANVGGRVEFGKNFDVMIDVGIGHRKSLMLSATYRF